MPFPQHHHLTFPDGGQIWVDRIKPGGSTTITIQAPLALPTEIELQTGEDVKRLYLALEEVMG